MTAEKIVVVIFFYLFSSALSTLLNCPFIWFLDFLSLTTIFCFINQEYRLIQISEGLLYSRSSLQGIWSIRRSSFQWRLSYAPSISFLLDIKRFFSSLECAFYEPPFMNTFISFMSHININTPIAISLLHTSSKWNKYYSQFLLHTAFNFNDPTLKLCVQNSSCKVFKAEAW
jgi:hypothetical protein